MVTDSIDATVAGFDAVLGEITARVFNDAVPGRAVVAGLEGAAGVAGLPVRRAIAVAYSGGLDSSVLLALACDHAREHDIALHAFHVHHGLSPHADAWLAHCNAAALACGIPFDSRRITVDAGTGDGTEATARNARYAALGMLCREHDVPLLLTAHHQDDQAETVMLQLLRGSGVAGLSGMDCVNQAPGLLGDPHLTMGRPLLGVTRAALQAIATCRALTHVDDPSNLDPRHARNALRHHIMPVLEAAFPGFVQRFARTARHAQAAQQLLIELAAQDLKDCAEGDQIAIERLRLLSPERIDNLLRYWFASRGMRMPSTAWLQEMRRQLLGAKADAQLLVGHADCDIHRHRNRIVMTPRVPAPDPEQEPAQFTWTGASSMHFAPFAGTLHFEQTGEGVDAAWLRDQRLSIGWRSGGWQLKLAPNRPTRSLKYHYQAANIPAWERGRLPLVTLGRHLLFAAGIGMDCLHVTAAADGRVALRWQPDGG